MGRGATVPGTSPRDGREIRVSLQMETWSTARACGAGQERVEASPAALFVRHPPRLTSLTGRLL